MIGTAIRLTRLRKEMTQRDLAERSGISDVSISRIERGEQDISLSTLKRIADGLGVTEEQLFAFQRELDAENETKN